MMHIKAYQRARTIDEARELLVPGAAYLAGGTRIISSRLPVETVIDINPLGLDAITAESLGATARLQDVYESPAIPDMLREAIGHHLPATWRNAATIGGEFVFGGAENDLLVALLALDAQAAGDGLITAIRYRRPRKAVFLKVSRLKTDRAVVNAAAAMFDDGPRLVLGGVAPRPVVIRGTAIPDLSPKTDFRGSAAYRRQVAHVLAKRALEAIQ